MGLEYFARQCQAHATETDALLWCVTKEATCCGICSDTLASVGTRVGLTFAVFFATFVLTIDGPETPFVFLTTSLQALAYLLVVLWEGLGGRGISRFHSYYALFCSFGWIAPLAAASLTATHYGYGGHQTTTGERLLEYRTDLRRRTSRSLPTHSSRKEQARDSRAEGAGSSTPSEASPVLAARVDAELVPIMSRRRSQRIPADLRHTPASLLGLSSRPDVDRRKSSSVSSLPCRETLDPEATLWQPAQPESVNHAGKQRHFSRQTYDSEELKKIVKRVNRGRWRRWGYPLSVLALWILWLITFLLIRGTLPGFTLSQTNCQDPKGTDLFKHSAMIILALGPVVVLAFLFNYHTQWLPWQLRRIFDFNRSGSACTRFLLPGVFSGFTFALWQALLWHGYNLASQPDSSLLAANEHSTTFATVLSLALTIKPVTDLVKAVTKIRKRKIRERRGAQRSPTVTPTVLPDISFAHLPALPTFAPLGPPAVDDGASPRSSSRRPRTGERPQNRIRSPSGSVPSSQQTSLGSSG